MSKTIWRISNHKHSDTAFSGEGSRRDGGRWNSRGRSVVYTSATLSLAALEYFVHMEIEDAENMLVSIQVDIPADIQIETFNLTHLPSNWRNIPAPTALATIGDKWFDLRIAALFVVPSAIITQENNYLINPLHNDFAKMQIHPPELFGFDPRMWK